MGTVSIEVQDIPTKPERLVDSRRAVGIIFQAASKICGLSPDLPYVHHRYIDFSVEAGK